MLRVLTVALAVATAPVGAAEPAKPATPAPSAVQDAAAAVRQADRLARDPGLLEQLEAQRRGLSGLVTGSGGGIAMPERPETPTGPLAGLGAPLPPPGDRPELQPVLLVSFSIPQASLRALVADAAGAGVTLVLRGLVNDSMDQTAAAMRRLLGRDQALAGASFAIDPTLFERFQVGRVPALILPLEPLQACDEGGCAVPAHAKVAGEASLDYLLSTIVRGAKDPRARQLAAERRKRLESKP
ncbi:type-F conjugative transfer system pilin assembly protein TrbC [Solimonas sp. SE-A11]|uniref:type-F conjugative transfer system pilin assembly protein TrbC n=1 Tax=Solimonas sp. SE-A11 TaxID=3054954 RepID=UPI00259C7F19|nr:type-F conjugative transfer system pilin assembly protein TrbC [Solimonas sp. SE-A11]